MPRTATCMACSAQKISVAAPPRVRVLLCDTHVLPQSGKSAKECASLAEECQGLRNSFFRCKKGQADPRSRIQGQKGF
jgi:hypothetical protein